MTTFKEYKIHFEKFIKAHFAHRRAETGDVDRLFDAMEYSLMNGGKRFRPLLSYSVSESLELSHDQVAPWAAAVECIHTYSLIHDDLPCMDDDDVRRGAPTNHKKFDETTALLAGDALLTEAFYILAENYQAHVGSLVSELSNGAGLKGMIRGQCLDLGIGTPIEDLGSLIHLHELKTGCLIALSLKGPAIIAGRPSKPMEELGLSIGLAFQVKDDILDIEDGDEQSFISYLGTEATQAHLVRLTEKIQMLISEMEIKSPSLEELIVFNLNREQ